ncbi:MAG: hypothetical protein AAB836_00455 [Patescibacteria group bacterium]
MPISLSDLAESKLATFQVGENLEIIRPPLGEEETEPELDVIYESVRSRIELLLKQDRKQRRKEKKTLPELEKTPYAILLSKMCGSNFDVQNLTESEKAILGFLPIGIDKKRVGNLIKIIASKVTRTYAQTEVEKTSENFALAEQAVLSAIATNLKYSLGLSFNEMPIDLSFLREGLSITSKDLKTLINKLKAEGRTSTEDILGELGLEDEKTISYLTEKITIAGKKAIKFYRSLDEEIEKGQIEFAAKDSKKILYGEIASISPYLEDSQADLFTLLDRAFSKEEENVLFEGLSKKCEAQILLQIRLLNLLIESKPLYKALIDSSSILSPFTIKLLDGTKPIQVMVPPFREELENNDEKEKSFHKKLTLRVFEDGMPPIYMDDEMREKAWESIMLKIITGEAATERVVDMVAGQGAIYGINTEDLIPPSDPSDYNKLELVEKNIAYIKRICIRTAVAMGCTEDLSNEDLSEKGTDYHFLQPSQFKIVMKIHGDPKNEKSHNFSAFKVYMAVEAKNGSTHRIEFRYLPWDTFRSSKSKKSLSGDWNYSLKKVGRFIKIAIRRSQNERLIEVVERLLELLVELEDSERVSTDGLTASE